MTAQQLAREIHDFMRTWEIASKLQSPEQAALAMAKGKRLWLIAQETMRDVSAPWEAGNPAFEDHAN